MLPTPLPSQQDALPQPGRLALIAALTRSLDGQVRYCHWKSNEHLDASLGGQTDLDVLVDPIDREVLEPILATLGFKRFVAPGWRSYPGIEDYLGLDTASGALVHLHLHSQLTLGVRHLKDYRLPWEGHLLASRHFDAARGIYLADPHWELLLLLVRGALKLRTREHLRVWLGKRNCSADLLREYRWLLARVESERVRALALRLLGARSAAAVERLMLAPPTLDALADLQRASRKALAPYRRHAPLQARLERWRREARMAWRTLWHKVNPSTMPMRRTVAGRGLIVAILGADGSGKSTVSRALCRWLAPKVDVLPLYFGSGDGPASILRLPLVWTRRLLDARAAKSTTPRGAETSGRSKPETLPVTLYRLLWGLTLAFEKRSNLRRAEHARARGFIVVCDRYPQRQVMGFNDGPLLQAFLGKGILGRLAAWEAGVYALAEQEAPDLVVKLTTTPEVALARKPETGEDAVRRKLEAVEALRFPAHTRVLTLDAGAPLDEIVRQAKRALWEGLP